jgi:hypothetical protein
MHLGLVFAVDSGRLLVGVLALVLLLLVGAIFRATAAEDASILNSADVAEREETVLLEESGRGGRGPCGRLLCAWRLPSGSGWGWFGHF